MQIISINPTSFFHVFSMPFSLCPPFPGSHWLAFCHWIVGSNFSRSLYGWHHTIYAFKIWSVSLSKWFWDLSMLCYQQLIAFYCWVCVAMPWFFNPFFHRWAVGLFPLFWPFQRKLLWMLMSKTYVETGFISLGNYWGVGPLRHMVTAYLTFSATGKLSRRTCTAFRRTRGVCGQSLLMERLAR